MKKNKYEQTKDEIEQDLDPLETENRAITLMDDPANEPELGTEVLESADERDLGQELKPSERISARGDNVPSGMDDSIRGEDGEIERKGEDLETGEDGGDHMHRHAEAI